MEIIIASQNQKKIEEIRPKIPFLDLLPLDPKLFPDELLEEGETLEANARQKMQQVAERTGKNCFADDTGLEIDALNGEPGVYSARYAGENKDSEANMDLVLQKLEGVENRTARFKTVIALNWEGEEHLFTGICEGVISYKRKGDQGFGYDPIFIPNGYDQSFAEMSLQEKNKISHRGKAVEKLVSFLKTMNA